jgi:hypothetical protein
VPSLVVWWWACSRVVGQWRRVHKELVHVIWFTVRVYYVSMARLACAEGQRLAWRRIKPGEKRGQERDRDRRLRVYYGPWNNISTGLSHDRSYDKLNVWVWLVALSHLLFCPSPWTLALSLFLLLLWRPVSPALLVAPRPPMVEAASPPPRRHPCRQPTAGPPELSNTQRSLEFSRCHCPHNPRTLTLTLDTAAPIT